MIDIFTGILKLIENGIAMTDLKAANTIYDSELNKGLLIDLGGYVKV